MATKTERSQIAQRAISSWRARPESQRREIRQSVVLEQVIRSMAMENEPVSQTWIQQATTRRA